LSGLSGRYRGIAGDMRGHGDSSKPSEWAEGNVQGTAQEIFDAIIALLDSD